MISDDDLLLYYYRDGLDLVDRARIGAALAGQPELAQRLHGLVARLDAAAALPEVPVPAEVRLRWQVALERAAHADRAADTTRPARAGRPFAARWLAAAAVAAGLAVILTIQLARPPTTQVVDGAALPASPAAGVDDASAYERGLKWHLASTERQLAGLARSGSEERAHLIETIIAQNRLYAVAAERAGEPRLARVLRAFAPVLEGLAHERGDSSASIAQLSFELRVMQGRLNAGSDARSTTL